MRVRPGNRRFPYNENSTKALTLPHLNAACHQLTLLTGRKKSRMRMKVQGRPMQARFIHRLFPYNENPTKALNTTSLKCCWSSTDAIDRQKKKSRMRMKVQARFIEIHQVFAKKN